MGSPFPSKFKLPDSVPTYEMLSVYGKVGAVPEWCLYFKLQTPKLSTMALCLECVVAGEPAQRNRWVLRLVADTREVRCARCERKFRRT